jgi:hypothetical protein
MTELETYIKRIRLFLKDFTEKNQLLDGEESTNDVISEAITSVYNHCVIAPPVKMDMPLEDMTKFIWFKFGVVSQLLDSEAILNIRNTLPYQDGGVQVDENYKAGPYSTYAINLWQKFETGLKEQKLRYNIDKFRWGGTDWVYGHNYGYGNNMNSYGW